MMLSLLAFGGYFFAKESRFCSIRAQKYLFFHIHDYIISYLPPGWIPLVALMVYVVSFSIGFGPIPWLMMGELFPSRIRGAAASIATAFNWTCTFIVTKSFMDLQV